MLTKITTSDARKRFTNVINRVAFEDESFILTRRGEPVAALVSMEELEYNSFTVIIIVEVRERLIGMIVDTVSDVLNLPITGIQDTPHFSAKIETDFIEGIGQKDDQLIIILNVEKILTQDEIDQMQNNGELKE